ncbi:MAG: 3-deoxy-manno-octulosonate cytidylyltransferase [Schwartzia succinivorans]|jgi:3-deoxy-manno-octulosonate cytidylyltransferase (CMP-KDO synthetase)|nr:3-deoxy-manno-octulosonate cytidylyltransferase [Schwartzia succinivorans]
MKILCVIPARYASTRLPGKPLKDVAGKPMICRVYDRASQAKTLSGVVVATDDERILRAVEDHGGRAMMTAKDHPTGTDRLAEVAEAYPDVDLIINVQGDEPLIEPSLIDELGRAFDGDAELQMATVMTPMEDEAEQKNPNNVKVVTDKNGCALYFSRSLLPYPRNDAGTPVYKHIGIYAYRRDFLLAYAKMAPTPLERTESLEQLRALENGYKIKCIRTNARFVGVDTPEDLAKVNEIYRRMEGKEEAAKL